MQNFASNYYLIFGLITLVGGAMGFVRKRSRASLIAGLICGIGLMSCSSWITTEPLKASLAALIISLVIFFRFFMVWARVQKIFPHVPIILLSLVSIIISIIVWLRVV